MKNVILIKLETRFQRVLQWKKNALPTVMVTLHFLSLSLSFTLCQLACFPPAVGLSGFAPCVSSVFRFFVPHLLWFVLVFYSIYFFFDSLRLPFCVGSHVFACMDAGVVNKASYQPITVSVFGPPPFCKLQQSISGDGL